MNHKFDIFCWKLQNLLAFLAVNFFFFFSGHYLFIESSAPRRPNDKARLVSPVYQATATKCLNFWYSMYGADVGHLRVYIQSQNSSAVRIWDLYGDQNSPDWKQGRVAYYSPTPFTVSNEPTTVVIFFFFI